MVYQHSYFLEIAICCLTQNPFFILLIIYAFINFIKRKRDLY